MRATPRSAAVAATAALLVAAGGGQAASAAPAGELAAGTGAVTHPAAVTAEQQQTVQEHWTPDRMRQAVPVSQLAADVISDLPTDGEPVAGTPIVVDPTVAGAPQDAEPTAFPHPGGPWTGGGAVTSTAGRVFFDYQGQASSCSGNAVTSANSSVVMTAGHCIKLDGSYHTNWLFVPGYDHGSDPYGTWTAAETFVTPQWESSENINYDIGAVRVNSLDGQLLTDVVGGQGVAFNQPRGLAMYSFGYPAADPYDGTELIYCSGNTFNDFFTTAIGMSCDMTGGSSGGPWFYDFDEGSGTGIQNSVNSFGYAFWPGTMFGPYFGSEGETVYHTAQSS